MSQPNLKSSPSGPDQRILLLAPSGRDSVVISDVLMSAGLDAVLCTDVPEICALLPEGAGALLIADEALASKSIELLSIALKSQPTWSDLPVLIMTTGGEATALSRRRVQLMEPLGNVMLLERPLRIATFVSSMQGAIRTRNHQYEIRKYIRELRQGEERYRTLAEALPQLVWTALPDGNFDYLSRQWEAYTGISQQRQLALKWMDLVLHADDRDRTYEAWMAACADQAPFDLEFRLRRNDGVFRWHKTRGAPLRDANGRIAKWFGTCTDIDEEKDRSTALERLNRDLEQFAFSASHDLQEPLRMVGIYTQMLERRYGHQLDDDAREYIGFAVEGAKRMEMLVRDLLAYTQVARAPRQSTAPVIDTEAVLNQTLSDLRGAIEEASARVEYANLPSVAVHEFHMRQLLQNLIENALKYRSETPPLIRIAAAKADDKWLFSVRDNGIGIEPQYAKQVFGVFRRLHPPSRYPGTGIGLAICQKIAEHYGCRIWVDSELGQGATFFFTLPATDMSGEAGNSGLTRIST